MTKFLSCLLRMAPRNAGVAGLALLAAGPALGQSADTSGIRSEVTGEACFAEWMPDPAGLLSGLDGSVQALAVHCARHAEGIYWAWMGAETVEAATERSEALCFERSGPNSEAFGPLVSPCAYFGMAVRPALTAEEQSDPGAGGGGASQAADAGSGGGGAGGTGRQDTAAMADSGSGGGGGGGFQAADAGSGGGGAGGTQETDAGSGGGGAGGTARAADASDTGTGGGGSGSTPQTANAGSGGGAEGGAPAICGQHREFRTNPDGRFRDVLRANEAMTTGDVLEAEDGGAVFFVDERGYLLGANGESGQVIWTNEADGATAAPGGTLEMTADGTVELRNAAGETVWSVPDADVGVPGSVLHVQHGVLRVLTPSWNVTWQSDPEVCAGGGSETANAQAAGGGGGTISLADEGELEVIAQTPVRFQAYSVGGKERGSDGFDQPDYRIDERDGVAVIAEGEGAVMDMAFIGTNRFVLRLADGPLAGHFLTADEEGATFEAEATAGSVFLPDRSFDAEGYMSIESELFPGQHLRHSNFSLQLDPIGEESEELARRDATFEIEIVE